MSYAYLADPNGAPPSYYLFYYILFIILSIICSIIYNLLYYPLSVISVCIHYVLILKERFRRRCVRNEGVRRVAILHMGRGGGGATRPWIL